MTKVDEVAKKIAQAIEKANSVYVYISGCGCAVKVLCELRDRVSEFPTQSKDDELDAILLELNNLCDIFDSFKKDKWEQTIFQSPVEDLITNFNKAMDSLIESLEKIDIKLTNEYTFSTDDILNDMNSLYGKLADPFQMDKPEIKSKLNEIDQYRGKISTVQITKEKSDSIEEPGTSLDFSDSDEMLDEICNFNEVQKHQLEKTDYTQEPRAIVKNSHYLIYEGKMKLSKQDITIMVLNRGSFSEDKFRRIVNILKTIKHPNLESFIGAVESPLPYTIVTRRNGKKLHEILKREKEEEDLSIDEDDDENDDENNDENEDNNQIKIKPGYRTIIAYKIALAMAYLHSLNITHRDLCTQNVMIDKECNPQITNFANIRMVPDNQLAMSYKPSSSCDFRAPEIIDEEIYKKEVDIFSFAGILYELLTDTIPFSGKRNVESLIRQSERPELPSDIDENLKNLIESCWHQDSKKRPSFAVIVQTMLTNSIEFPQDKGSPVLEQFYAMKKIKIDDLKACFVLFKKIQEEINNSFVYTEEAARIRNCLLEYQHVLQTSDLAKKEEIKDENICAQICNLRSSLEDLLSTFVQIEKPNWSKIALRTPALEIPNDLHEFMKQIYLSLHSIGFNVTKYDFVNKDLELDLRFIYDYIDYNADKSQEKDNILNGIQDFMNEKGFELIASPTEINESVKEILSDWKDYEINRSDFKLSRTTLGKGVSCKVYKAMQSSTKKTVAVKELLNDYICTQDQLKLLRREIGILSQLKNKYLINFIGFNDDPGKPIWIVTEYINNGNLMTSIEKNKLTPLLKTKIAFEIAQGMEYLRSKQILHRDLKSLNVMLEGDFNKKDITPKIGDFGYSRADTALQMTIRGTPRYMAPEVVNGDIYDFKADVFSYGMILWDLYDHRTKVQIEKDTILSFNKMISEDLKQLILDTMNYDPLKRPSFTEIINRMIDNKISFNGCNNAQVEMFYQQKAEERSSE